MPTTCNLRTAIPPSASAHSRYYFDIADGTLIRDEIGREIDAPLALRREALRVITGLAVQEADDARDCSLHLTVRDATGLRRLAIRLVCQIEEL